MVSFNCLKILWMKWKKYHIFKIVRNVDVWNFNLIFVENKNIIPQHVSMTIKIGQILITHRNYMNWQQNRRYTIAPFCCNNIMHNWPTHDRASYFNVFSVWASFFVCCFCTVEAFERLENSVSTAKKLSLKISPKVIYSKLVWYANICENCFWDKHIFVMINKET